MAFCEKCGKKLPPGSAYCEQCGTKLDTELFQEPASGKWKKQTPIQAVYCEECGTKLCFFVSTAYGDVRDLGETVFVGVANLECQFGGERYKEGTHCQTLHLAVEPQQSVVVGIDV